MDHKTLIFFLLHKLHLSFQNSKCFFYRFSQKQYPKLNQIPVTLKCELLVQIIKIIIRIELNLPFSDQRIC